MLIQVEVTDKQIADQLCAAIEGGIAYWCRSARAVFPEGSAPAKPWGDDYTPDYISAPLTEGGCVNIRTHNGKDDPTPKPLNLESVKAGLVLMAHFHPKHFADVVGDDGDATTGDVLVQLAVFGEIVFG